MSEPTPEMMARDLDADLAIVRGAARGPWAVSPPREAYSSVKTIRNDRDPPPNDPDPAIGWQIGKIKYFNNPNLTLILAARDGWEAAIVRARAAEDAMKRFLSLSDAAVERERAQAMQLLAEKAEKSLSVLRDAVRQHRDAQGDDRCVQDDYTLYRMLPEGLSADYRIRLNDPERMLTDCVRFVHHRHDHRCPYLSPQREIDARDARIKALEQHVVRLSAVALWQGAELTEIQARDRAGFTDVLELRDVWLDLIDAAKPPTPHPPLSG